MPASRLIHEVCARVAKLLHDERVAQDVSMTRLAEGAGLSRQMISYVERGARIPTLDTLLRITNALKVDLADIITRAHARN